MKLIIEDDEGRKTVVPVVRDEITIGRQDGNTIKLTERNVSRKHARLWKADGSLKVEDLGSYNGVRVNGDKIEGPTAVHEGDLIEIGDYDLGIQGKIEALSDPKGKAQPPPPAKAPAAPPKATPVPTPAAAPAPVPPPAPPPPQSSPAAPVMSAPIASGAGGATAIININQLMAQAAPQIEVRDLQKSEMPRLVGLAKEFRGKEFYLMRNEWKIGRTEDNDAAIDHQSISRQHCKFVLDNSGDWKIYDNKSANGVKVNGDTYAVAPVKPGDTVELGHVKFRFCAPGEKFKPPEEKVEGAPPATGGKPPPTTAELIANVSKSGGSKSAAPPPPAKSNMGMIIGAVVGVIVLAAVGFFVMKGKGGGGEDSGGGGGGKATLAQAKAAEQKKDYKKASELADQASDATPGYKKKMEAEAQGQSAAERFDAAMAANNPDAARTEFETCSSLDGYYCGKVKEKEDAFKAAYAKKHIAAANAAKGTNPTLCSEEVGKVLAIESGNQEAQGIQCSPNAPPPPPKPATPVQPAGPTPAQRDAQAAKLLEESTGLVGSSPDAALAKLDQCIALHPSSTTLGSCLRNAGVINARKGDTAAAAKYFKKYLPMCRPDDCDKIKGLIAKFGG